MNSIKTSFSIRDLEILSGIKAHTIRIWEKRYNILNPTRINRNVRVYGLKDLQKLLNLSVLYHHDYKISKLSSLTASQLATEAQRLEMAEIPTSYFINELVMSMYTFDEKLFQDIYAQLMKEQSFEDVFIHTYIPLLERIGVLWQTGCISLVQEHFISNLIYQKLAEKTCQIDVESGDGDHVHVFFLPEGEMHELGLLYLNYCFKKSGKRTIYLGRSIPIDNLLYIKNHCENVTWVSSFTINKSKEDKKYFVFKMNELLSGTNNESWIIGSIWKHENQEGANKKIRFFNNVKEILERGKSLKIV